VALSKLAANSFDLTDNYAFTGTTTGATSTQKLFLIKNIDASSSGTVDFVNGASSVVLDILIKHICLVCKYSPCYRHVAFQINFRDGGSNYDATKTTTFFDSGHSEDDSTVAGLSYDTGADVAQGTGNARLSRNQGNGSDECCSGEVYLFNPSSTTFVKHFMSDFSGYDRNNINYRGMGAGYCNVTAAIDAVRFQFSSGNIDSGRIALYGIK